MQELFPTPRTVADIHAELAGDDRPSTPTRPWVMANMIASVDGAYTVDGTSGGLSVPGDREVFHALRGLADVILVGAATAREERYRRPAAVPAAARTRSGRAQAPVPLLVVVSRSGRIPTDQPFLDGDGPEPILVHPQDVLPDLPAGVVTMQCGTGGVDLHELMRRLRHDGHRWVLCEGGPGLLGQLHRADLLDELFVTVSPNLVGGHDVGLLGSGDAVERPVRLHRLWTDDTTALFATYRRSGDHGART